LVVTFAYIILLIEIVNYFNFCENMLKVVLIGGLGTIGQIIYNGLGEKYTFVVIDKRNDERISVVNADISDYQSLFKAVPEDADILVDLTAHKSLLSLVEKEDFELMKQIYVQGIYNVFEVAKVLKIPKVIYVSTSHVTGLYENDGYSLLKREIKETDYPQPDGVYGAMKLFGESIARLYAKHHRIKTICLRFGGVNPGNLLNQYYHRRHRIILYHEDLLKIAEAAFVSDIDFGIYYAVSNNADKPWSIYKLRKHLKLKHSDFVKRENSSCTRKFYHRWWRTIRKS